MLVRARVRFARASARSALLRLFLDIFEKFCVSLLFFKKKVYFCAVNQLIFCFMSKATNISKRLVHVHELAIQPSAAVVLSDTEYEILLIALFEFKQTHIGMFSLSEKGVAIVDALELVLRDSYCELNPDFKKKFGDR